MLSPKVTVLMPAYNAEPYIGEAIDSILNQTFTNFEFMIINDGSSDSTGKIIKSYNDKRINYIELSKNIGLIDCLNLGIYKIDSPYICRMDADDVSVKTRLEFQVNEMENNPDLGVCGTWYSFFDSDIIVGLPVFNEEIKVKLLIENPVCHPSAVIRTSVLKNNNILYNKSDVYNEDYGLWIRLSYYTQFYNIPKPLLFYRLHQKQISISKREEQKIIFNNLRKNQFYQLLDNPGNSDYLNIDSIIDENIIYNHIVTDNILKRLLENILNKNLQLQLYNNQLFEHTLSNYFINAYKRALFNTYINASKYNLKLLASFIKTMPKSLKFLTFKQRLNFIVKCIIYYER